jgi:hypothetical protein
LCLCGSFSKRISQRKENFQSGFRRSIRPGPRFQVDSEIQPRRAYRRLISEAETCGVGEFPQVNVGDLREYISRVIEQCPAEADEWKAPKRDSVFDISDRHYVSTFQVQDGAGPGFIETEATQSSRAAGEVSFRGRQLLRLPWGELGGFAERMIPSEAKRSGDDPSSHGEIKIRLIE